MSPATVVVTLDPQEGVLANLGEVVPRSGVDELLLVGREEGFGDCVIEARGAGPIERTTPFSAQKSENSRLVY